MFDLFAKTVFKLAHFSSNMNMFKGYFFEKLVCHFIHGSTAQTGEKRKKSLVPKHFVDSSSTDALPLWPFQKTVDAFQLTIKLSKLQL